MSLSDHGSFQSLQAVERTFQEKASLQLQARYHEISNVFWSTSIAAHFFLAVGRGNWGGYPSYSNSCLGTMKYTPILKSGLILAQTSKDCGAQKSLSQACEPKLRFRVTAWRTAPDFPAKTFALRPCIYPEIKNITSKKKRPELRNRPPNPAGRQF